MIVTHLPLVLLVLAGALYIGVFGYPTVRQHARYATFGFDRCAAWRPAKRQPLEQA